MACIYCLETGRPSRGRPHVVPEAVANNDLVLPRGAECDGCNAVESVAGSCRYVQNCVWETRDPRDIEEVEEGTKSYEWSRTFADPQCDNYGLWSRERDWTNAFNRAVVAPAMNSVHTPRAEQVDSQAPTNPKPDDPGQGERA